MREFKILDMIVKYSNELLRKQIAAYFVNKRTSNDIYEVSQVQAKLYSWKLKINKRIGILLIYYRYNYYLLKNYFN